MFYILPSLDALKIHFRSVPFCVWTLYYQCFAVRIWAKIAGPDLGQGRPPTSASSRCAPDVTLDFYSVLVCCSHKVLPPKKIKEIEIEGYGSLKGEGWEKINVWMSTRKNKKCLCYATLSCDCLKKFLKLNATIIYTVLLWSN